MTKRYESLKANTMVEFSRGYAIIEANAAATQFENLTTSEIRKSDNCWSSFETRKGSRTIANNNCEGNLENGQLVELCAATSRAGSRTASTSQTPRRPPSPAASPAAAPCASAMHGHRCRTLRRGSRCAPWAIQWGAAKVSAGLGRTEGGLSPAPQSGRDTFAETYSTQPRAIGRCHPSDIAT